MDIREYNSIEKALRQGQEHQYQDYKEKNGRLYKKEGEKYLKVLKENEIDSVLFMLHNHPTAGHFGVEKTYQKIKERFYWKTMLKDIKQYIKYCDSCQRRGKKGGKSHLYPIPIEDVFERIGIDYIGPLPKTANGNKYIIVAMDYLTKWPEAKAVKEATAKESAKFIYENIICRFGCPKIILSDRGTHFKNELIKELCDKFMIKHKLSSPYHPQTNGLVERFNRTLKETLSKTSEQEDQWDEHIEEALLAYRTNKHTTTKFTPFYMLYGKEAQLPIDEIEVLPKRFNENNTKIRNYQLLNLEEERLKVLNNIKDAQQTQKQRNDSKIKEESQFKIGEKVLLKESYKEKQWSGKLRQNWKGPYYVHENIGKGAYRIKTLEGKVLKATQNVKNLKKYYDRRDILPKIFIE